MDAWDLGRPCVSRIPGVVGMAVRQRDSVRWARASDGSTPPVQGRFVAIDVNSERGKKIIREVHTHYIDTVYKNSWKVETIVAFSNELLTREYVARVQDMRQGYRQGTCVKETWMFNCVGCDQNLQHLANEGYVVKESEVNFLGDSRNGVTLSRYADIQLKVAELILSDNCWMVVYKVALGNCRLIADVDVQEERLAVSPEYDHHEFAISPDSSQMISEQAMRNQIYIFEFTNTHTTSSRPRQILPLYAIKLKKTCEMEPASVAPQSATTDVTAVASPDPSTGQHREPHVDSNHSTSSNVFPAPVASGTAMRHLPPPQSSCQYDMLSPNMNSSTLQNQQHPVASCIGLQKRQHTATVPLGLQNQKCIAIAPAGLQNRQHPVAITTGLQNWQHPVAVLTGLQNQQHHVTVTTGLQNQQHHIAVTTGLQNQQRHLPTGLQNQQHHVAVPTGMQNQQHHVAVPTGLQNQQHHVAVPTGMQNQQHHVSVPTGMQNQQHHVAVPTGLQNQQHHVAVPTGLQNQQHHVAVPTGLQNQQHHVAVPTGLQNQQHHVAVPTGLQNQQHHVAVPTGLQNQQHHIAVPTGLQDLQNPVGTLTVPQKQLHLVAGPTRIQYQPHPVAICTGMQNQQHAVVIQSERQTMLNYVASQTVQQNTWNPMSHQEGQMIRQSLLQRNSGKQNVVNQTGVQNMSGMPTARLVIQRMPNLPTVLSGCNQSALPWSQGTGQSVSACQLSGQSVSMVQLSRQLPSQPSSQVLKPPIHYGRTTATQKSTAPVNQNVRGSPAVIPQNTLVRQRTRGRTDLPVRQVAAMPQPLVIVSAGPGETVLPNTQPPTPITELSHSWDVSQSDHTFTGPSGLTSIVSVGTRVPCSIVHEASDAYQDIRSPVELGMRLPTMVPMTEPEPDPSQPIKPIIIQPMSDLMPSFLRTTPAEVDPVSDDVERLAVSSQGQNPAQGNLFSGNECERQNTNKTVWYHVETPNAPSIHDSTQDPLLWNNQSSLRELLEVARTSAVSLCGNVETSSMCVTVQNPVLYNLITNSPQERHVIQTATILTTTVSSESVGRVKTSSKQSELPAVSQRDTDATAVALQDTETAVALQDTETAVTTQGTEIAVTTQGTEIAVTTQDTETTLQDTEITSQDTELTPQNTETTSQDTEMISQNTETAPAAVTLQDTEITSQDSETSAAMSVMQKTETTSAHSVDRIIETVSEFFPASATDDLDDIALFTHGGVDDLLGSVHCDIDSGKEVFPTPEIDKVCGSVQGSASQTESGIVEKAREVSQIYVHDDGMVELIIEEQVSAPSDDDIAGDSLPNRHLPCGNRTNWHRFLNDKQFQPVVVLHKVDCMQCKHTPTKHSERVVSTEQTVDGDHQTEHVQDAACCSGNVAEKASTSTHSVPVNGCINAALCDAEQVSQTWSCVIQEDAQLCSSATEKMGQMHSVAVKSISKYCQRDVSQKSSVNQPQRIPCKPVMTASSISGKPSGVSQHSGLPIMCKPCGPPRKHKMKAHAESFGANKRCRKEYVSKPPLKLNGQDRTVKMHRLPHDFKSNGMTVAKRSVGIHNRGEAGKHNVMKCHSKHRHARDSSHKRSKKTENDEEKKKPSREEGKVGQATGGDTVNDAESLPTIKAVVKRSRQRPYSPKSVAQKLSPTAKPWRLKHPVPGEMPPKLKIMAAKLKHGSNHDMLATWQKNIKTNLAVVDPASASPSSHKNALVQKAGCVRTVEKVNEQDAVGRRAQTVHHPKARWNNELAPSLNMACKRQNTHKTSSAALMATARCYRVDSNIINTTASCMNHHRIISLNHCKDALAKSWMPCSVQERDTDRSGRRKSSTDNEIDRNVQSVLGKTLGIGPGMCPEDTANNLTQGNMMKSSGLLQSPVLSADSSHSDRSAFTPVTLPEVTGSNKIISVWSQKSKVTRTVHKTPSHESLGSVLTEAWQRPTSQHAVGSSAVYLQGKEHSQCTNAASKESMNNILVCQDTWSRHGSGQRDTSLVGQSIRSRHGSGQRDTSLVGQNTRSRHGIGQGDTSLVGQNTRSRHGSGQIDTSLVGQSIRSRHGSGQRDTSLVGQNTRSRHGSGQRDTSLVGQNTRSRHGSGQRDTSLVGQNTRSRHGSGQRDTSLVGQNTRSRHGSGQRDTSLVEQNTRSRHGSGQRDTSLVGQNTRSRHGSGQRDTSLVGQNTRSRHGSGQRDTSLIGQDTWSRHGSGQSDTSLVEQDTRSRHGSGQSDTSLVGQNTWSRHGNGQKDTSLVEQDTRSRHGSGQSDTSLVEQDTRSRHGSGQSDTSLVGQNTWSRHGNGQRDTPPGGLDTRSSFGSHQRELSLMGDEKPQSHVNIHVIAETANVIPWSMMALNIDTQAAVNTYKQQRQDLDIDNIEDPRLFQPEEQCHAPKSMFVPTHDVTGHQTITADMSAKSPITPTCVDIKMFKLFLCKMEHSSVDWDLMSVNLRHDGWNTSDFGVASSNVSSIMKDYWSKPAQKRHQVMLVYSAKLKKELKQIGDDEMFADISANASSSSSCLSTHDTQTPAWQKKQLERQNLYTVLADIKASVTADKVKIASMPVPDKGIHRRIDRCRLDTEIINEGLSQLNRFHTDKQIQIVPQILRLCSELEKYISVEGQFFFTRVRPLQLDHCSELYALKVVIESVYKELSSISESGVSTSRKHWLFLALGWLHTHRRKKLTEICHVEVQQVCQLAGTFEQRLAWYRKMQTELQKSPEEGSAIHLLDNPLKYLDRRILNMTKHLEFIRNLSSCNHCPVGVDPATGSIKAVPQDLPGKPVQRCVQRAARRLERDTIVKCVCLPDIEDLSDSGSRTEVQHFGDGCYDAVEIDDICHNDYNEAGEELLSNHYTLENCGQVEDSTKYTTDDESEMSKESGENEAKAVCSEHGDDIIDDESEMSKETGGENDAKRDDDIMEAESYMSKLNYSDSRVKDDDDVSDAEYNKLEDRAVLAMRGSSTEMHKDVVDGENKKLTESEGCKESETKTDCCRCLAKESDSDDDIDDENYLSQGNTHFEENSTVPACGESHGGDIKADINDTEVDMSPDSIPCEDGQDKNDYAKDDTPKRSENSDDSHVQESGHDSVINDSSVNSGGSGRVDNVGRSPVQQSIDDTNNASEPCKNKETENNLAERVRSVDKSGVCDTEECIIETSHDDGESCGEDNYNDGKEPKCNVSHTNKHREGSCIKVVTTKNNASQHNESESGLNDSGNSIYEPISDDEDMNDEENKGDGSKEVDSVNNGCKSLNANVEYVYRVVKSRSESTLKHTKDSVRTVTGDERRNICSSDSTSRHKVDHTSSCVDAKPINIVVNVKAPEIFPEMESIDVNMTGRVSHCGHVSSYRDLPDQTEIMHTASSHIAPVLPAVCLSGATLSKAQKWKHRQKISRRVKRLQTDSVAVEIDTPAVMRKDAGYVDRHDDKRSHRFAGKSLGESQLNKSYHRRNKHVDAARGFRRGGDAVKSERWQGVDDSWSASDASGADTYWTSDDIRPNEALWFDVEHGVHREYDVRGHRHHRQSQREDKHHRHTRWHHHWKLQ